MINILIRKVHDFLFFIFERNVSQYNKSNKHSSITFFFSYQKKKTFFLLGIKFWKELRFLFYFILLLSLMSQVHII